MGEEEATAAASWATSATRRRRRQPLVAPAAAIYPCGPHASHRLRVRCALAADDSRATRVPHEPRDHRRLASHRRGRRHRRRCHHTRRRNCSRSRRLMSVSPGAQGVRDNEAEDRQLRMRDDATCRICWRLRGLCSCRQPRVDVRGRDERCTGTAPVESHAAHATTVAQASSRISYAHWLTNRHRSAGYKFVASFGHFLARTAFGRISCW